MERSMRVCWLRQTRQISFRASSSFVVGLLCVSVNSMAWADAFTDRFQADAREGLQKPYRRTPYPCSAFYSSSGKDGYVVDMAPWAAAAGLRRGDHPVAYGGTRLTGIPDSDYEIWSRVPYGEYVGYVDIRVERAGKEISLRLPCRDDRQRWEASVGLLRAIAEGRWQDCVDAVSRAVKIAGYASSVALHTAILCMLEKAKSEKQRLPDEYWRRLHGWATKAIEEAHYSSTGLAPIRTRLLDATETLEKAGRRRISVWPVRSPSASGSKSSQSAIQLLTCWVAKPSLLTASSAPSRSVATPAICRSQFRCNRVTRAGLFSTGRVTL